MSAGCLFGVVVNSVCGDWCRCALRAGMVEVFFAWQPWDVGSMFALEERLECGHGW